MLAVAPAQAAGETVVTLTFDDANADQMPAAALLKDKNLPATFFINSGYLNQPGWMSTADLATLSSEGHEIGGHTRSHPDLVQVPADEALRQICNDRVVLSNLGYKVTSFAYPFASSNASTEAAVQSCGYNSGRGLGDLRTAPGTPCATCDFAESIPPTDPYWTRAADQVDSSWTLQRLQQTVTDAAANGGGWVQLTFHHICDGCDQLALSPAVFDQFTTWLAGWKNGTSTQVKTVDQVIGGTVKPLVSGPVFVPPPAAGPGVQALQNPSFETVDASGLPTCWWDSFYGINTATFATVSPGRTGNNASQVTVSGYTSGDAKRLQIFDGGACAPTVVTGQTYSLRAWYKSTGATQFTVYYRQTDGSWLYGTSSPWFAAATDYTQAVWDTPAIPAGVNGISFALNVFGNGQLTTDDYAMYNTVGAPPAQELTSAVPTITGTAKVGSVLTANAGTWAPAPVTLAYQWLVGNTAVTGATAATYTPVAADVGKTVTVQVTGTKTGYATKAVTSAATAAVAAATVPQLVAPVPTITGTAKVGSVLTANAGTWTPAPVTLAYQWLVGNVAVPGATAKTYKPVAANVGKTVTVRVTGTKTGYASKAVTSAATAAVVAATAPKPPIRLSGANRYETSARISAATFSPGVPVAYVATGSDFPDALSGGPAAGATGAPMLLVSSTGIPPAIMTELLRLKPARIVVLGSSGVVSSAIESALAKISPTSRIAGADRYETSARISAATFKPGVAVAYVATGADFPDALSGGAAAGSQASPVLLVQPTSVPAAIRAELQRLKPAKIVVLGSTGVVSAAVATALNGIAPTTRVFGADRYATSASISAAVFSPDVKVVYLATGADFPDALSGGPAAIKEGGPVLLVRGTRFPRPSVQSSPGCARSASSCWAAPPWSTMR
ncbi:cell wall-binding repeat-containing protein [Microterricola viridarii]|uniref:cell wall-binding repeat-containing protein n=1 Tax=Microterricola viridarii TaxID=412690 RepID=UPI001365F6EF|nr:cell wall-binding repeat-containing protein [Microterricola viridarii]